MDTSILPEQLVSLFTGHGEEMAEVGNNIYRLVNQPRLNCQTRDGGLQLRIPDGILYVNGLPLVVFEFKSAVFLGKKRPPPMMLAPALRTLQARYT